MFWELERTTKFMLHPVLKVIFFFGRSVDSLLLSETSGHYNNKRAKDEVEGLFLKPSDSHH